MPLLGKGEHNTCCHACGFLSNLGLRLKKTETLYALVYTLYLDNDKEMRIFRGLSRNVFSDTFLDKNV